MECDIKEEENKDKLKSKLKTARDVKFYSISESLTSICDGKHLK